MIALAAALRNAVDYSHRWSIVSLNEDVQWVTSLATDLLTENACTQPRFNRRVTMEISV